MGNLDLYNKFRTVPKEAQKTITAGKLKGFTDINPMWRIKMLTEEFGVCGQGWKTSEVYMWTENAGGECAAFCSLNLYFKVGDNWSDPVFGIGGSKLSGKGVGDGINDEAFKMAYTDAISIACKNLGMAADIYFAKDRTKYNSAQEQTTPQGSYQPMDDEMYWKIVQAYAKGQKTKTGGDYRQTWIETTHAGEEQVKQFDLDVKSLLHFVNA